MRLPMQFGDCAPFDLAVDEKWLAAQMEANPGKAPGDIIGDHLANALDRGMKAQGEAVTRAMREMFDAAKNR